MPQIIAGIYELKDKIGAGGGGVVYLGEHTRLKKQVVLKADKRKLSVGAEKLRREVDLLKGLSHTYIPQVYDFVQEDETVYTVMDYIEGESLDKMIGRGERPSQPDVVRWACQLLEALDYLHNRPPYGILHGDIKPANIMLRPNGDVCLIDFNIALALGEEGAVKVGFSRGYASPEHYGADYIRSSRAAAVKSGTTLRTTVRKEGLQGRKKPDDGETAVDDGETVDEESGILSSAVQRTSSSSKGILLDVRSDIYSLGATLYHLLSGIRPAQDAREVKPLDHKVCSEAVSFILQKAMNPQPDERYQTAQEMLFAFLHLHKKDNRAVRHQRHMVISAFGLGAMFLAGAALTFVGQRQLQQRQEALTLSEYSANALAEGDISSAISYALRAIPASDNIFQAPVTAEAQAALTEALGIYDLSEDFKAFNTLVLPGAPFDLAVSPDGTRLAVVYAYETAIYDMESLDKLISLPVLQSALSDCVFIDDKCIVYAGVDGLTCCNIETGEKLWTGETATTLAVSADRSVVAAVNRDDDYAVLYQSADGEKIAERSFEGRHLTVPANDQFADAKNDIFTLNADGSMLAVSFSNGGFFIYDCENPDDDLIIYEDSEYKSFSGGFCGKYFAFAANDTGKSQFGLIDVQEGAYIGGYEALEQMAIQADEAGIYLSAGKLLERVDMDTMTELEMAFSDEADILAFSVRNIDGKEYTLVTAEDHSFSFYDSGAGLISTNVSDQDCAFAVLGDGYAVLGNRSEPVLRILKLEHGRGDIIFAYDARYVHDEARISYDMRTTMLYSYQGFRIYDVNGGLVASVELPAAENIYDQQFYRDADSSYLEVIWYDGMVRRYSAADGSIISEKQQDVPAKDLYEEFFTDRYRFASELHAAPRVYDIKSGNFIAELEKDAYLTYVTQIGDYIVTEYVSAQGERYGLLLDEKLQKLARLPGLCDVVDENTLIFDDESGNLRQSRLYSLQELIALGESYKKE